MVVCFARGEGEKHLWREANLFRKAIRMSPRDEEETLQSLCLGLTEESPLHWMGQIFIQEEASVAVLVLFALWLDMEQ